MRPRQAGPPHHALVAPLKTTEQMRKRKDPEPPPQAGRRWGAGTQAPTACARAEGRGVALEANLTLLRDSPT